MTEPAVSLVIPVFNGENVLAVSLAGHSLPMLRRIAGLKRRWARGLYSSDELHTIADQRYWNLR